MNIQQIMKQAQQMQQKLQLEQEKMKNTDFEGTSGNGAVKITMTGDYNVKSINIDKNLIDPEEKDLLEDLIKVATNDCIKKIIATSNDNLNSLTGGMNLPF